ncbi:hypothetical protein Leryth_002047 [Lithospermum erythrorhizon]|nr:hypothetical protein Leryth_002047 [Lithospermum erythrorhizon]
MFIENFKVESPNVKYNENEIHSVYNYETTELVHENRDGTYQWIVKPKTIKYEFMTHTHVPKLGVMLVGWGGNNGSTLTGGVIANREYASTFSITPDIYLFVFMYKFFNFCLIYVRFIYVGMFVFGVMLLRFML